MNIVNLQTGARRDIFFRNNIVDIGAIRTFLGTANGAVYGMYDQTGNGRAIGQATTAAQPSISALNIVDGIIPVSIDGQPDGSLGKNMQASGLSLSSQSLTVLQAVAPNNSFNEQVFFEFLNSSGSVRSNLLTYGSMSNLTSVGLFSYDGTNLPNSSGLVPRGGQVGVIGLSNSASTLTHYLDGASHTNSPLAADTLTTMNMGYNTVGGGGYAVHNLFASVVYNTVLSASDVATVTAQFQKAFSVQKYAGAPIQIVFDGTSAITGQGSSALDTTLFYLERMLNRPLSITNMGVNGQLAANCQTNFSAVIAPQRSLTAVKTIYLINAGPNDITGNNATGAQVYGYCKACCQAAKSAGFTYSGMTTMAEQTQTNATYKQAFTDFNTAARAGVGTDFDILMDAALDLRLNNSTAMSNPLISPDGEHLTSLGQSWAAQTISAMVGAFL